MKMKLGDVFKLSSGKSLPEKKRTLGNHNVYGGNGITGNHNDYFVEKPTIVIGRVGEYCGAVHLTTERCWITDNALMVTEWYQEIDKEYLVYALNAMNLHQYAKTVGQPSISQANVYSLDINLPFMEQQQEIVKILNLVSKIIIDRKEEIKRLEDLIKARFVEMFGGIYDSKKYPYKPVRAFTEIISGGTPSRDIVEYWENGTIPWVKTTELQNNIITYTDEHITEVGLDNSSAKLVPADTILIAMYGQGKTRGMTGYLGVEACTNQACACILPSDSINQIFLWKYFVLSYDNLRGMAKGGNQPNLNGNIIKNYPVLYPPIDLQNEFADFVHQVDKLKVVIKKSLEETEKLFDSLMQKYFG